MSPTVSDFQPVRADVVVLSGNVTPSVLDSCAKCEVEIEPLIVSQGGLPLMDMSVISGVGLTDGMNSVPPEDCFPAYFPQRASLRRPLFCCSCDRGGVRGDCSVSHRGLYATISAFPFPSTCFGGFSPRWSGVLVRKALK